MPCKGSSPHSWRPAKAGQHIPGSVDQCRCSAITADGLLASMAVNFSQAAHSAVLPVMPHACSLFKQGTASDGVLECFRPSLFMTGVLLMPCEHCALQDTAVSAFPDPCHLCPTKCVPASRL